MNRDKENLSIKYNTSVDRKLSHQIHPIANSKKSIFGKPAEVNLNEKKTGVNSRKSSNIFVGSKQNKLQENQMKRKSVSPIASSKFKTPITNNSNNANTKPHEKKTNLSEVQKGNYINI